MTPTFSESEYRRLMLLAYLGEWMVNAIRKDPDPAYEDLAAKVYSFAQETPMKNLIAFNENTGNFIATESLENDADAYIDQYDDKTFWEELTSRMTERDMIAQYSESRLGSMRPEQRERNAAPIAKAYTREFEEFGIDRLRLPQNPLKNHR